MALTREPEKPETENFQCALPIAVVRRWKTLMERANKQRVNLRKAFGEHFITWLDEVEADLNAMTVRPIRSKAEE
jgi:hypothetical protein